MTEFALGAVAAYLVCAVLTYRIKTQYENRIDTMNRLVDRAWRAVSKLDGEVSDAYRAVGMERGGNHPVYGRRRRPNLRIVKGAHR